MADKTQSANAAQRFKAMEWDVQTVQARPATLRRAAPGV